jgi:hypothetical protein
MTAGNEMPLGADAAPAGISLAIPDSSLLGSLSTRCVEQTRRSMAAVIGRESRDEY